MLDVSLCGLVFLGIADDALRRRAIQKDETATSKKRNKKQKQTVSLIWNCSAQARRVSAEMRVSKHVILLARSQLSEKQAHEDGKL